MKQVHILVVDDNELIRTTLSMYLRDAGYLVDEAGDGQEALDHLQHAHPDAVLMDIEMPVMDGIAATRAIRSEEHHSELSVFAFTGVPQSLSSARDLFTGVLCKPMAPTKVQEALLPYLPVQ